MMKTSQLSSLVQKAVKQSIKEALELKPSDVLDHDEVAFSDHQNDLNAGITETDVSDVETLLMGICDKFKKAQAAGINSEIVAQAVELIEKADDLLSNSGVMEEALTQDRENIIGQIQLTAKKIENKVPFSRLETNSLSVMASNLQAIANKLN